MTLPSHEVGRSRGAVCGWLLAFGVLLLAGFALRVAYYHGPYFVPDENITMQVVGHLRHSGDWDTNWARADLTSDLRYDQYNFSSHLYATYIFYRLAELVPGTLAWRSEGEGLWVYRFFSVLLGTLVVGQTMLLGRRAGGGAVALGAGALVVVATQLVQEAHFMRPEAFTTVLTLAVVALCWPRENWRAGLGAAAFLIGLLLACKVSMLLIVWLPLVPLATAWSRTDTRTRWVAVAVLPVALAAGFAAGAPGAVAHPAQFISGVRHLMAQYGSMHPPHSHIDGRPVADMMAGFFIATLGWPVIAGGMVGTVALAWRRRWAELALLAGPVVVFASYFATKGVFFERNLSHVLPLGLILAALGVAAIIEPIVARGRVVAPVLFAGLVALLVVRPAVLTGRLVGLEFSGRASKQRLVFEAALRAQYPAIWLQSELLVSSQLEPIAAHFRSSKAPLLLGAVDYGDEWSASGLRELASRGDVRLVGEQLGSFATVPTSTLVVYHSWRNHYFLVTNWRTK